MEKKFKGTIKEIKHIVCSDPCYEKGVWCRYEKEFKDFKYVAAQLSIEKVKDHFTKEEIKNIARGNKEFEEKLAKEEWDTINFVLTLSSDELICFPSSATEIMHDDLHFKLSDEITLGMDTASMFLGINNNCKNIDYCSSISTGTDGGFGIVREVINRANNKVEGIVISGWADPKFVSLKEMVDYLKMQFEIEDMEEIK